MMVQVIIEKDLWGTTMLKGSDLELHFQNLKVKHLALANAGKPISDQNFITLFLTSLLDSYKNFCMSCQ